MLGGRVIPNCAVFNSFCFTPYGLTWGGKNSQFGVVFGILMMCMVPQYVRHTDGVYRCISNCSRMDMRFDIVQRCKNIIINLTVI